MKALFRTDKTKTIGGATNLKNPQSCVSCGLYKNCLSPKMKPYGENRLDILFLGEAPGEIEDRRGKQWQGPVGRLLQSVLRELGINLFKDALSYNSCNCRPAENATPTGNQIYCCRQNVLKVIKQHKPKLIFLLGNVPVESVIGFRWKKGLGGITRWRGWHIPDQDLKAWICPVYHPSFVRRNEDRQGRNLAYLIWKRDIANALTLLDKPVPDYSGLYDRTEYVESTKHLRSLVPKMAKSDLLSFDYESTGLKPHRKEQKLISVSAAFDKKCYAWLNNSKEMTKLWRKVLRSRVPKTAHNLQFEEAWSREKVKTRVNNWKICTMNSSIV